MIGGGVRTPVRTMRWPAEPEVIIASVINCRRKCAIINPHGSQAVKRKTGIPALLAICVVVKRDHLTEGKC